MISDSNPLSWYPDILVQHSATAIILDGHGEAILAGMANRVARGKLTKHGWRRAVPLAQVGQSIRRVRNDLGEPRGNFALCGLSDQKIDHDTAFRAVESRTEHAQLWPLKEAKQKAVAARERVSDIMADRS